MIDDTVDSLKCFGQLEKVLPTGEDGFQTTPVKCIKCSLLRPCTQAAKRGIEGLKLEEKHIDRAYERGLIGTLERWSKKKLIQNKIERQSKQDRLKQKKTT